MSCAGVHDKVNCKDPTPVKLRTRTGIKKVSDELHEMETVSVLRITAWLRAANGKANAASRISMLYFMAEN